MNFKKKIIFWSPYLFLGIFSFFINYWVGSRGVFSIDTFVHFDSAVRILKQELGYKLISENRKTFLGVYEHFYDDNFLGNQDFKTHYIILAKDFHKTM